MSEILKGQESLRTRGSFLRPFVDKIRHIHINDKWLAVGVFVGGLVVGSLVATAYPALGITCFGISIVAAGLLVCATDALDIARK
ncbi:MAG: hypothetical protein Q7R97_02485 [Candidatus Daviesbacteria bacterium]|nr:hypothetical protein [Candidatus Daviesbacteria bacterium]